MKHALFFFIVLWLACGFFGYMLAHDPYMSMWEEILHGPMTLLRYLQSGPVGTPWS